MFCSGHLFQVAGAEQQNVCLANAVLANGSDSRVVVAERRVLVAKCDDSYAGVDVVRTLYASTANL